MQRSGKSKGLNLAQYAKHLGVTPNTVTRLKQRGIIVFHDDASVNVEETDRRRADEVLKSPVGKGGAETISASDDISEMSFTQARTENERIRAEERRLKVDQAKGELINRRDVEHQVFELARQERDAWALWPVQISAQLAAELGVDTHRMQKTLDAAVREKLASLSEIKF